MAIEKKLIHFKKWSDFSSKKLSANETNTQYTLGVDGALTKGAPDILYQSICWIKDERKMWTHGTVYDCSGGANADLSNYVTQAELDELVEFVDDMNGDVANLMGTKQDTIPDLADIRSGAAKGATSVQPSDLADVATSGSYNDLVDKPTIPSAVTESTVSGWGFTKNTGTYSKPSGGIPRDDLADDVRSALVAAESYKGTVIGVKVNNSTKMPNAGIVDMGTVGTYSKPSTGIPKSDLASDVQTTLDNAATFVVTAFDLSAIYSGDDIVHPGKDVLMNAIREGKAVRVPLNKDYLEIGYVIAQAYCEDLLYMTIADSHSLINIETSMSDPMLYASDITIHTIANRAAIEKVGELEVVVAKGVDDGVFLYTTPTSANGDEDDVLLSRYTVKTINGESIFGSGDIAVGGVSEDYVDNAIANAITNVINASY